ncbi:uncharacterized protein LOC110837363 isoform X2 [Zootermopsis nevadensis]|uniref:uncharacterized protein LOC110837363 isoform X1 n=1 Tax=Zootermopsis nevadensis TaxID=136037 RepID=UPI000B8E43E8|nr:uncharacterized protein LOC110837363 isoform X1 [Zootermopsis nevadensis]XP_021935085.1 uncharacterized protein LOC110837363 isoform X2 [Zootermopsis nevadensis]
MDRRGVAPPTNMSGNRTFYPQPRANDLAFTNVIQVIQATGGNLGLFIAKYDPAKTATRFRNSYDQDEIPRQGKSENLPRRRGSVVDGISNYSRFKPGASSSRYQPVPQDQRHKSKDMSPPVRKNDFPKRRRLSGYDANECRDNVTPRSPTLVEDRDSEWQTRANTIFTSTGEEIDKDFYESLPDRVDISEVDIRGQRPLVRPYQVTPQNEFASASGDTSPLFTMPNAHEVKHDAESSNNTPYYAFLKELIDGDDTNEETDSRRNVP